jgi:nitrogen fixation NifU-like protein
MNDLRDLYEELILDHNRHPRNFGLPHGCNYQSHGINPLCGDDITVYLTVEDGVIKEAGFKGHGCAISTASASMMTESLKGKTVDEAEALFKNMHNLLTQENGAAIDLNKFGKLRVLAGVHEFPARVKCATLAWHTMHAALKGEESVSTE